VILSLPAAVDRIMRIRRAVPVGRGALVAISGIDGAGKGFIAVRIAAELQARGLRIALINVDGWLNLPHIRFSESNPAEHFYLQAIRFDEMFSELVLPLRDRGSVRLDADCVEETAVEYRRTIYEFKDIDVILVEGIFVLRRDLRDHYDLSIWIECGFETALMRAVARGQEGLPADKTIAACRRIYFPAQRIHFERDRPREAADFSIINDA
jgi:uridine kinase